MARTLYVLIVIALVSRMSSSEAEQRDDKVRDDKVRDDKLLLIVCDSLHWRDLDIAHTKNVKTPAFDRLVASGVKAAYVKPAFVSTTFPNLWTLVTGRTPEHHGIVHDRFYDPELDETFSGHDTDRAEFYADAGEPLWQTNAARGGRSVVSGWPSGGVTMTGEHVQTQALHLAWEERVDYVVTYLSQNNSNVNLGLLYFEEPRLQASLYGPQSPQVALMLQQLDGVLGYLLQQLQDTKLLDRVNIVLTGLHGIARTLEKLNLDHYVEPELYDLYGTSAVPLIWPKKGALNQVYARVSVLPYSTIYHRADLPEELHYRAHPRISPLVLVMQPGFRADSPAKASVAERMRMANYKGCHGYNNSESSMWAAFIAWGPAFKSGYTSSGVDMIDVYPLLCRVLGVTPQSPHDGLLGNVKHLLRDDNFLLHSSTTPPPPPPAPDNTNDVTPRANVSSVKEVHDVTVVSNSNDIRILPDGTLVWTDTEQDDKAHVLIGFICIAVIGLGFTIAAYVSFVWKKRRWLYVSEMDDVIARAHRRDGNARGTRTDAEHMRLLLHERYTDTDTE